MNTKDSIRMVLIGLMEDSKTSGKELANAVGVSKQAVSAWRTGKSSIDIENVPAICNYFGISISDFFAKASEYEDRWKSGEQEDISDESKLISMFNRMDEPRKKALIAIAEMFIDDSKSGYIPLVSKVKLEQVDGMQVAVIVQD